MSGASPSPLRACVCLLHVLTALLVIQEAQATTDTLPSSLTKVASTKSVRTPPYLYAYSCPVMQFGGHLQRTPANVAAT